MCQRHLLGEHLEAHIFLSKMEKKYSLKGFSEGSMFFGAEFIKFRHDWLASLIAGHKTPLEITETLIRNYPIVYPGFKDSTVSVGTLVGRCGECSRLHQQADNQIPEYLAETSVLFPSGLPVLVSAQ